VIVEFDNFFDSREVLGVRRKHVLLVQDAGSIPADQYKDCDQFDQYAGHCIVSNFQLHCDSHSQIPTVAETLSAPALARTNLIRLQSLD